MSPARLALVLLAALAEWLASGCAPAVCHCPNIPAGPGWCDGGVTAGECSCPVMKACPGFCLDAGTPEPCDGG